MAEKKPILIELAYTNIKNTFESIENLTISPIELWSSKKPLTSYPSYKLKSKIENIEQFKKLINTCPKQLFSGLRIGEYLEEEKYYHASIVYEKSKTNTWITGITYQKGSSYLIVWGIW